MRISLADIFHTWKQPTCWQYLQVFVIVCNFAVHIVQFQNNNNSYATVCYFQVYPYFLMHMMWTYRQSSCYNTWIDRYRTVTMAIEKPNCFLLNEIKIYLQKNSLVNNPPKELQYWIHYSGVSVMWVANSFDVQLWSVCPRRYKNIYPQSKNGSWLYAT